MAFVRPTLSALVTRIEADLVTRLGLTTPILRRSVGRILARVMAGAAHMLHGHLEYLSQQVFPDQSAAAFLLRQGALYGMTKTAATYATGTVTFIGTNGTVIPAGTVVLRSDEARYSTDADVTIAVGIGATTATAELAGADGNCDAGTVLTLEAPISGCDNEATAGSGGVGLSGGTDEETDADFRTRVLARMADPPHGGNSPDYVAWAREVAGVTRAWCYPNELGAGTVVVRFMRDGDASPIPDAGEVATVQAYLDALRPVTAALTVAAPVELVTDYTVAISPDTAATRTAVEAQLADLHLTAESPGTAISHAQMVAACLAAVAEENPTAATPSVVVSVPAGDVSPATGEYATLGTVTFV